MDSNHTIFGLLGIIGIWLTAGICLPLVKVFNSNGVKAEQLMAIRGLVTALLALPSAGFGIFHLHWEVLAASIFFALACLGLFKGVIVWGAGKTIVVITATPVVNMLLHIRQIDGMGLVGFVLICIGVIGATDRAGTNQRRGWAWSAFGTIMNGLFYEFLSKAKTDGVWQRCFWQALAVMTLGLLLSRQDSWKFFTSWPSLRFQLSLWAFVQGFLYFVANILAFDNLPLLYASILAQGETPAVILMAGILLQEKMDKERWAAVIIALIGTSLVTLSLVQ